MSEVNNEKMYPTLSPAGQAEAVQLIEKFKSVLADVAKDVLSTFYTDITPYIESDSWMNFRNDVVDLYSDYSNARIHEKYDSSKIRRKLLDDYHDELCADLNQDLLAENAELKKDIAKLHVQINELYRRL